TALPGEREEEDAEEEQWTEVLGEWSWEESQQIQKRAREEGVTLSSVLQGSWAVVLQGYSGEPAVIFGATVAGREGGMEGVEEVVGLLINTLPVCVQVRGE